MSATNQYLAQIQNAAVRYSDSLARLAFTYVKSVDDAEDIVQDVFLAYLRTAPAFDGPEHEKAWLIRTTINRAKDVLKSAWMKKRSDLPDGNLDDAIADGWPPRAESLSYMPLEETNVLDAVLALEEKYRTPLHLHYYGGYTIAEIAAFLDEKPATIGTRLARGRELLKKSLEE